MTDYPIHAAAKLFPEMTEVEYFTLRDDIGENGQRKPITLWRGELIDGRHRLWACKELGIEPHFENLADDADPWGFVVSENFNRRHLSTSQRAMVAAELSKANRGGARGNQHTGGKPEVQNCTLANAAASVNVSERSAKSAKNVLENGTEELINAVKKGKVKVSAAEKQLKKKRKPAKKATESPRTSAAVGETQQLAEEPRKQPATATSDTSIYADSDKTPIPEVLTEEQIIRVMGGLSKNLSTKTLINKCLYLFSSQADAAIADPIEQIAVLLSQLDDAGLMRVADMVSDRLPEPEMTDEQIDYFVGSMVSAALNETAEAVIEELDADCARNLLEAAASRLADLTGMVVVAYSDRAPCAWPGAAPIPPANAATAIILLSEYMDQAFAATAMSEIAKNLKPNKYTYESKHNIIGVEEDQITIWRKTPEPAIAG